MDMQNKVCVVTGANCGIGKETVRQLARKGASLAMICRNEARGEAARKDIIESTGNKKISLFLADFAHQNEIRAVADQLLSKYSQIHVLVNNAGTMFANRMETKEGIEMTFAVNHLAPFLLTNLLLPSLKKAPAARIITVASEVHRLGARFFDLKNLQLQEGFSGLKAYGISKLCNIMFSHELARRTASDSCVVNSLHPGAVRTNLANEAGKLMKLFYLLGAPFMKSSRSGAQTPVFLATSEDVKNISGSYFINKKERTPASIANDDEVTTELWKISTTLTNL